MSPSPKTVNWTSSKESLGSSYNKNYQKFIMFEGGSPYPVVATTNITYFSSGRISISYSSIPNKLVLNYLKISYLSKSSATYLAVPV